MTDIKTALSGIKIEARPEVSPALSMEPQNDRGLSTYEEFLRATKFLKAERETRLAIAQAESQRQGVVVNAGKN